jgi:L-lysine 2,3-aminomutase
MYKNKTCWTRLTYTVQTVVLRIIDDKPRIMKALYQKINHRKIS